MLFEYPNEMMRLPPMTDIHLSSLLFRSLDSYVYYAETQEPVSQEVISNLDFSG